MKVVEPVASPVPRPLVLYVEDEAANWEVTELQLRRKYQLLWARTDEEACALLRQYGPQLHAVLLDVQLQGSELDGLALARLIRGRALEVMPAYARDLPPLECPVFFVTAFGRLYPAERLREAGGDASVPKPVDFVKLTMLLTQTGLRRALERSSR
ncbi:MAG: response regulator [Myxococcota bacterium]